jgi:excisionase family DNA binding protein
MVASLARTAPIPEAPLAMDELTTPGIIDTSVSGAADTGPYSAREAATVLGVSERTVRRAIARGELAACKRAGVFRITLEALSHYLDQQPRDAPRRSARQHASSQGSLEPPPSLPMLRLVASAPGPAFTLPQPLTPFLGRDREVAAVVAVLNRPELRLLTLTGPGGVGKTRLALRVAEALAARFGDGVAFVPLASVADASLIPSTVAQALGVREHGGRPIVERLIAALRGRRLLLILDNFEHVLPASPFVSTLLTACPGLTIVVTSRTTLRLSGEQRFPVPPMALPGPAAAPTARALRETEAVQFFVARARAAQPAFALDEENAAAVAAICWQVDGLPLAIELAAARVAVLPVHALLARLEPRFALLTDGPQDAPPRLRSMRHAIGWSYDLLRPGEQSLFRRLSVFAGGWTLEAMDAIASAGTDVINGLSALVASSLVRQDGGSSDEPRYLMLETLREFGQERLVAAGDAAAVRGRHAQYFLALVERWSPDPALPGEQRRMAAIDPDYDNVRIALAWFGEHGDAEGLLRLSGSLFEFWHARGLYSEGRLWIGRALVGSDGAAPSVRVRALMTASALARYQGDLGEATSQSEAALPLARKVGNPGQLITALLNAGLLAYFQKSYAVAEPLLEEALNIARGFGDDVAAKRPITGIVYTNLGHVAFAQGHLDRAAALYAESIALLRAVDYGWALDGGLTGLGGVHYVRGDIERAAQLFPEALELAWGVPDPRKVAIALLGIAGVGAARGRANDAARLLGAAEAITASVGVPFAPSDRPVYERVVTALVATLGEARWRELRAAGRSLSMEAAVATARALVDRDRAESGARRERARSGLTPREVVVLRLIALARTDQEIAETLFISRRTVNGHVARILTKLEAPTRRAAVERAQQLGLMLT